MQKRRIVLVSCVKKKAEVSLPARDLYQSPFFRLAFGYAESLRPDRIYILSAKYGLLRPETVVAPYEKTLNKMPIEERRTWANAVLNDLRLEGLRLDKDAFVFLAGSRYREFLEPSMRNVEIPMRGLGIGKQLQFLERKAKDRSSRLRSFF